MGSRLATRIFFILLSIATVDAHAAGFAISEQSPVAGGTGGAGAARDGDGSAAWYNPAALADGAGWRSAAGVMLAFPVITSSGLDGTWEEETEATPPSTPFHVYLSYARGPWAAGLAFNVPFGSSVRWPEEWTGRFETVSSRLQVFRLSPFFSFRFGQVRVGAGFHMDVASLQVKKGLDFVDQEGQVALDLGGVGFGGHASVFVDLTRWLSLGAVYRSRTDLELSGTALFDAPAAFSIKAHDQFASADYHLPDLITVGARVRPSARWSVLLDVGVAVWSVYDKLVVDFEDDATTDVVQQTSWETQVLVRAGAELEVTSWLTARAGMFYDPTPIPEETLAPNSPDSDRLGFSVGAGVSLPMGLSIDLFYTHVLMLGQPSTNDENLRAEYAGNLHMLGVGIGWRSSQ